MTARYLDEPFDVTDAKTISSYDETWLWSARFGLMLLDRIDLRPDMRVLDVGCGTGFPLFALGAALGPSSTVVGLDPWAGALRRAALKRDAYGMAQAHLIRADAARMPFADASFDLVTSNLGVNNFDDAQAAIRECARVLRPGGRIAITTNLQGHMQELYDTFRAVLEGRGDGPALRRLEAHLEHRTTPARLRELCDLAGLNIEREDADTFVLRYVDATALLWHWFIRVGFLPAWRAIAGTEERDVLAEVEDRLNDLARRHGELRLTIPTLFLEASRK